MVSIKDMSSASRAKLNSNDKELNYPKDRNAVPATDVQVDAQIVALNVGETVRLTAIVSPEGSIQRGTWSLEAGSDGNESAVTLSPDRKTTAQDVLITGAEEGTVSVVFTSEDGDFTDSAEVTVSE